MSKAILISDKPKWCALMMNGDKNIEVRISKALANAIQKLIDEQGFADIYVYCSKGKPNLWLPYEYGCFKLDISSQPYLSNKPIIDYDYKMNGKVVFKFRCYKVEEILIKPNGNYYTNTLSNNKLLTQSCLSQKEIFEYTECHISKISGCWVSGYAIHISDLEIFDEPKELSEFKHWVFYKKCSKCPYGKCDNDYGLCSQCCEIKPLTKAPQNYCYVEVE